MDINELIEEGYKAKKLSLKTFNGDPYYLSGEHYDKWIMLSKRYLQQYYPDDKMTAEFVEISKRASGRNEKYFNQMIGILKALRDIPTNKQTDSNSYLSIIETICKNFNKCVKKLENRRKDNGNPRSTLIVNDEYDVQDLLGSLLSIFINDIRPEDYVPSFGGSNSRIDFYLEEHNLYLETKMTSSSLKDKNISEQLIIDIARYRDNPNCKTLICFIYDKDSVLDNPYGIIGDLEKLSTDEMKVKVIISPLTQ